MGELEMLWKHESFWESIKRKKYWKITIVTIITIFFSNYQDKILYKFACSTAWYIFTIQQYYNPYFILKLTWQDCLYL